MSSAAPAIAVPDDPVLHIRRLAPDRAVIEFAGSWISRRGLPDPAGAVRELTPGPLKEVHFDARGVTAWDSGLVTFVMALQQAATAAGGVIADRSGLPEGVARLLALAEAVPEKQTSRGDEPRSGLARIGRRAMAVGAATLASVTFLGESVLAFASLSRGRARFRASDLFQIVQECGPRALGIVSLISFLIGLILAFVGAVQLQQFGASIYVADLVGIAMTREVGCIMTAIVMAGRTGAAFAAQLGTMNTNQEIDALSTMGISSMEFLVLPRMLALIVMMPLLTVYADVVGILGGAVVATGMLGLSPREYFEQTRGAVHLGDFFIGVVKSAVFGIVVALAGCLRGMQSGRSAAAVGLAATSAVVTSIVAIIVLDGAFAVLLNVLGL